MKAIITACTLVAFAFGAYFYIDNRYTLIETHRALAEDVRAQKRMNEYQFLLIQWKGLKNAIWDLKQKFIGRQMDPSSSKLLSEWETEKEQVERKMKALEHGG